MNSLSARNISRKESKDEILDRIESEDAIDYMASTEISEKSEGFFAPGTITSTVFVLVKTCLGAGMLGIPLAVVNTGVLLSLVSFAICGAATVYANRLLIFAKEMTGCNSYEELSERLFGHWARQLTSLLMFLLCWLASVTYVVFIGEVLKPLRNIKGMPAIFDGDWGIRLLVTLLWAAIIFPLSLMKTINGLRWSSALGLLCIGYLFCMMVVYAGINNKSARFSDVGLMKFQFSAIAALPTIIFSFSIQPSVFALYTELKRPSPNRISFSVIVACLIVGLISIGFGFLGSISFGSETNGSVLSNYNPLSSIYIAVGYMLFCINVCLSFPCTCFPSRISLLRLFKYENYLDAPFHVWFVGGGGISVTALLIGLFVPGVTLMFGIVGGALGCTILFLFPAAYVLKCENWNTKNFGIYNMIGTWCIVIFGIFAGVLGTILVIYAQVKG